MSGLLVLLYVAVVSSAACWTFRSDWTVAFKATILGFLVSAVPLGGFVLMAGQSRESFGFGMGLLLVVVVPANLLAIAIGVLWARLGGSRA